MSIVLVLCLFVGPRVASAGVNLYTDLAEFQIATGNTDEALATTAVNIQKADEVDSLPDRNERIGEIYPPDTGNSLTFDRLNTDLFYSFRFTVIGDSPLIVFDDDEKAENFLNFDDALSPGDFDDGEDDDWRIRLINPVAPLRAFGFELRSNNGSDGEFIRLYNADGELVHAIPVGAQPDGNIFLGVVSDEPFVEVRYDEGAGGDDIAVADFRFARMPVAPTAVDVYAGTRVNTVQSPQSAIVILEGADEAAATLTYSVVSNVSNGTLRDPDNGNAVVNGGEIAGQTLTYTPDANFTGTDSFTYKVNDGNEDSATRTATISVFDSWRPQALQIGTDLDGEAAEDRSGWSMSLSSDGHTVAIGAINNGGNGSYAGHVRIYHWNGASWVQLGDDIDGEAAWDRSGRSVSLSSDGRTVAIGAYFNDGNGDASGHVHIYRWNGASWVQRGDDIDGEAAEDFSGLVSLSSDGHTVAIGATGNDGNGTSAGHVRIYRWNGASWGQLGDDIDGEAAEDFFGRSVSLSSDGHTVAIGAYGNDGNGNEAGHVRIYDLTLSLDEDDDVDGVINANDKCPSTPSSELGQVNSQGCGPSERDTDKDGVNDALDDFPNDSSETTDTDGDGLGDNREAELGTLPNNPDSDGDGYSDFDEVEAESDPLSANDVPTSSGLNLILIKAAMDRN